MVPDQMLRGFLIQYRAALTVILFLTSTLVSLCVVLIEKADFKLNVQPLTANHTILALLLDNNGTTHDW